MRREKLSIEDSKNKLFKHWEHYVEKNEKLKLVEGKIISERKL